MNLSHGVSTEMASRSKPAALRQPRTSCLMYLRNISKILWPMEKDFKPSKEGIHYLLQKFLTLYE